MADAFAFECAGEQLVALADRALLWPARRRLVIADLHLGKGDAFRHAGIAVPRGGTRHDLDRLSALVTAHDAAALWILGDMLHGALVDTHWRDAWNAFRTRHAPLAIVVVAGNHDRALARAALDVEIETSRRIDAPFVFSHLRERVANAVSISGHEHPVVHLPSLGGRVPCFRVADDAIVLPAFSAFTGGHPVAARDGWIACVSGHLLPHVRGGRSAD
ncbi:MAG: ligase-associated DNA damage response endonuclease PdeM [Rhodanobacteraceae bacterium]